jgi:hypothetical protein
MLAQILVGHHDKISPIHVTPPSSLRLQLLLDCLNRPLSR